MPGHGQFVTSTTPSLGTAQSASAASKYYPLLIEVLRNSPRFKQGQAVEATSTLTYV